MKLLESIPGYIQLNILYFIRSNIRSADHPTTQPLFNFFLTAVTLPNFIGSHILHLPSCSSIGWKAFFVPSVLINTIFLGAFQNLCKVDIVKVSLWTIIVCIKDIQGKEMFKKNCLSVLHIASSFPYMLTNN